MKTYRRFALMLVMLGIASMPMMASADDFGSIEDRMRIEQVWARYALALDTADTALLGSVFTEDALFDVAGTPFKGRKAIQDFVGGMRTMMKFDARPPTDKLGRRFSPIRHLISNLVVDLKGNTATADSNWVELMSTGRDATGHGKPPRIINAGRYRDVFVKVKGEWLIKERLVIADLFEAPPAVITEGESSPRTSFPDNDHPTHQSP